LARTTLRSRIRAVAQPQNQIRTGQRSLADKKEKGFYEIKRKGWNDRSYRVDFALAIGNTGTDLIDTISSSRLHLIGRAGFLESGLSEGCPNGKPRIG
jgi:hypothetical protein